MELAKRQELSLTDSQNDAPNYAPTCVSARKMGHLVACCMGRYYFTTVVARNFCLQVFSLTARVDLSEHLLALFNSELG